MLIDDEKVKQKRPDRRVAKTKKAVCNAFLELLSQKDINDITIKEIADTADVNRKTVYNYYTGIHQILDEVENILVKTYESFIEDMDFKYGIENPYEIFNALTTVLSQNMELYGSLFKINTNTQLLKKIVTTIKNKLKESFIAQNIFPNDKVDMITSYIVTGMISAYQEWFIGERKQNIEDFSKDISTLILSGIKGFI